MRKSLPGAVALIANGLLLYAILAWLKGVAPSAFGRVLILALGNLLLTLWLVVPGIREGKLLPNWSTSLALLGWSASYCVIYGAFVIWPDLIAVWVLILAQAAAPPLAVFFAGDHRRDASSERRKLIVWSPILCLFAIAYFEWRNSRTLASPLVPLVLTILFGFSQSCARVVARAAPTPFWAPPRLAFANGIFLFIFWVIFHKDERLSPAEITLNAILLSVGILILQALYLFGLARATAFLSALMVSASVPIAMLCDRVSGRGLPHASLSLWLAVLFMVATGLVMVTEKRQKDLVPVEP
jgi:hypothetical protein